MTREDMIDGAVRLTADDWLNQRNSPDISCRLAFLMPIEAMVVAGSRVPYTFFRSVKRAFRLLADEQLSPIFSDPQKLRAYLMGLA